MYFNLTPRLPCRRILTNHLAGSGRLPSGPASARVLRFERNDLNVIAALNRYIYQGYSPKDEFRAKQRARSSRWREKSTQTVIKAGVLVMLTIGMCISGLVYRTIGNIDDSYSFFPDVSHLERGADPYIPTGSRGDRTDGRKKRKRRKIVLFPWLQSHSSDIWTLLKLCQSDNRSTRHLGIQAIADQKHWSDSDYRMAAQAMDVRTMIGLARTEGADNRLFLPPPLIPPGQDDLETDLRKLLSNLPTDDLDICTKYFTSNALMEGSRPSTEERGGMWCFGGSGLTFAESLSPVPPEVVELFCLQALVKHTRALLWTYDSNDYIQVELDKSDKEDLRNEMFFLLALKGHSQVASHCPLIVQQGGLKIMRRINDVRQHSVKIMRQIARILANLSLHQELHKDIINAGWVTILARWLQSDDFALRLHATKALANLDRDYGETRLYPDSVYLYYPQCRYRQPVYADVIFIHGLLGGPFRTWRQNDSMRPKKKSDESQPITPSTQTETTSNRDASNTESVVVKEYPTTTRLSPSSYRPVSADREKPAPYTMCWPQDWLAKDCPHVRILTVEYETHLSEWAPRCPYESEKRTLQTRSRELLEKLRQAGVGDRPIVWVGHSMGGLLIKQMLLLAAEDKTKAPILERSKGIVFYSVPHRGSPLAAYSNHTKYLIYPSVEVKELHQGSEELLQLHEQFKALMFDVGIPLLSFAEGLKTLLPLNLKVMIVPTESSDPGFGEFHVMNELNHLNICKPINKDSSLYKWTLEFIRACIPQHKVEHILKANMPEDYIFPEDLGEQSRGSR